MSSCRAVAGSTGTERHAPPRHDRQSEQRHPLEDHGRSRAAVPVRFVVVAIHQVGGQGLDPLRIDAGHDAAIAAIRFDQLRRGDPLGTLSEQCRSGPEVQPGVSRARVLVRVAAIGDAGEQATEQGLMDRVVIIVPRSQRAAAVLTEHPQLTIDVRPFAQPIEGQEVLSAGFPQLTARQRLFQVMIEIPQLQDAEEIRSLVGKLSVALISSFRLSRPGARAGPGLPVPPR